MAATNVYVIDPANRTGKILMPTRHLIQTEGFRQAIEEGAVVSLCMLYQKGRCRAGVQCRQVHADRTFVTRLRERASTSCSCCADHGDCRAVEPDFRKHIISDRVITIVSSQMTLQMLPIRRFGRTEALEQLMISSSDESLVITEAKLCRLHKDDKCRYGKDCKNFHVCREVLGGCIAPQHPVPTPTQPAPSPHRVRSSFASNNSECGMSSCPASPSPSVLTTPPSPTRSCSSIPSVHLYSSRSVTPETLDTDQACEGDCCTRPPTPRGTAVESSAVSFETKAAKANVVRHDALAALSIFSAVMRGTNATVKSHWF